MKFLNRRSKQIMDLLTAGLADPSGDGRSSRKIDNAPGVFMPACIERIGKARYSVAHYFEQNGDLMADPDLEFIQLGGEWVPVAIKQDPVGRYSEPVECDARGVPVKVAPRAQADLASFADMMIDNIREQQHLDPTRPLVDAAEECA